MKCSGEVRSDVKVSSVFTFHTGSKEQWYCLRVSAEDLTPAQDILLLLCLASAKPAVGHLLEA